MAKQRHAVQRALRISAAACLLAGAGPASAAPQNAAAPPMATTLSGSVQGLDRGTVEAFLGVPYAAPPVGDGRWRAPAPPPSWSGVRAATAFGPACMQPDPQPFPPWTAEFMATPPLSEDCLTLNLWRPRRRAGALPVLVWIHGGGFRSGSGAVPIYTGAPLAARGVIVVTINYRLGVFGFLSLPGGVARDDDAAMADFGLLDQIAALRWVRDNIAAFGGDPENVTLAGQSAGATSVNNLLMSPMAKGLFARAIAESGSGMGEPDLNRTGAERLSASFAALRALSAEQVEAIADAMRPRPEFAPTVDGHVVLADPEAAGAPQSDLPLLTGYTADEGAFFLLRNGATTPKAFVAGLLFWAEARSRVGRAPIFLYLFDHIYPGPEGKVFRSFHTAEVPYVFGVLNAPGRAFTAKDKAIVRQMQDAWLAFMRAGAPPWRAFQRGAPDVMELGDHPGATPAVSTPERLAAFREFVASGGKLSFW